MKYYLSILIVFFAAISFAQNEFHVFPKDGKTVKGTPNGDGSLQNPWDLQTALSQSSERVNGGDIIWLHSGVYKGNYNSFLSSTNSKFITVAAYKNDKVILNGNTNSKLNYVLQVNGNKVVYKDLELTYLGNFSRLKSDKNFKKAVGINHRKGEDCKFQNLVIHNIPGSGIGSWKATGGTLIEDCIIYNNGYQGLRGHGVGIYVQNQSEKIRLIRNNIIFNNYYKGIQVWTASSGSKFEYVKNVTLTDNIIFNNGSPAGKHVDNIIVATNDREGFNVAKNISIEDNVLYHNVDFNDNKNYGHGASLTLGYSSKSPVEAISVLNNVIIGKNNALNISHVKSLIFKENMVYAGYVHLNPSVLNGLESNAINLNANRYYTRRLTGFRINKHKDFKIKDWQQNFKADMTSEMSYLKNFQIDPVLKIKRLNTNVNAFNIVLLEKKGNDITVNFSNENITAGMTYKIYDIENKQVVVESGMIAKDLKLRIPMGLKAFEKPLHNTKSTKSAENFGVFRIEFSKSKKRKSFLNRFFGWLF